MVLLHVVVHSGVDIINYHCHYHCYCHNHLSYRQHMVVNSCIEIINYHYHCHDHLSYCQHMVAHSCVEMHGKSGVR